MARCRPVVFLIALWSVAFSSGRADAQSLNPGPPGPYVVDVRGAMSGVPTDPEYFPSLSAGEAVPGRGFGATVGGHVYAFRIGPGRLGFGADVMIARGSTEDVSTTLRTIAPQVSFNFGTSDGWSYLSGGVGTARVTVDPGSSQSVRATSLGGGARWFLGPHFGVGFDARFHWLAKGGEAGSETPASTAFAIAVGVSFK
jgi:hypothetical protein